MEKCKLVLQFLGMEDKIAKFDEQAITDSTIEMVLQNMGLISLLSAAIPLSGDQVSFVSNFVKLNNGERLNPSPANNNSNNQAAANTSFGLLPTNPHSHGDQQSAGGSRPVNRLDVADLETDEGQVMCLLCGTRLEYGWVELWTHMKQVHRMTFQSSPMTCILCKKTFTCYNTLRKHTMQSNAHQPSPATSTEAAVTANVNSSRENPKQPPDTFSASSPTSTSRSPSPPPPPLPPPPNPKRFVELAVQFMLELQGCGRIPTVYCSRFFSMTTDLISELLNLLQEHLQSIECHQGVQISLDVKCAINFIVHMVVESFKKIKTQKRFEKKLEEMGLLIPIEEITLGSRHRNEFYNNEPVAKTRRIDDTMYYVPIKNSLSKVLEREGSIDKIVEESKATEKNKYSRPTDGKYLRSLISADHPTVLLQLYFDELEICNVLGSSKKKHKLGLFYYTILNDEDHLSSKLSNIHLFNCVKSTHIEDYGWEKVLQRTVEELTSFFRAEFKIGVNKINVKLGQFSGDNLGLHQLFGFVPCFRANHSCRFCRVRKEQLYSSLVVNQSLLRNPTNYQIDVDTNDVSSTGVKQASTLNNIPGYHVTYNFCPDPMHDLYEGGVVVETIKLVVGKFLSEAILTLDRFNSRVQSFNYGCMKKNKPSIITINQIKGISGFSQKAVQTRCLFWNLSFLIGDFVTGSSSAELKDYWELYITLRKVVDYIEAKQISENDLQVMDTLIAHHHRLYLRLSGSNLIPKHHFLLHYSNAVREVGPVGRYAVFRLEAKYQFFKHISNISKNFKNITKTVTRRHQIYTALHLLNGKQQISNNFDIKSGDIVDIEELEVKEVFQSKYPNHPADEFEFGEKVLLNDTKVSKGDVMLFRFEEIVCPLQVEFFLSSNNDLFFVGRKVLQTSFNHHFHAFNFTLEENCDIFKLEDLYEHRVYSINEEQREDRQLDNSLISQVDLTSPPRSNQNRPFAPLATSTPNSSRTLMDTSFNMDTSFTTNQIMNVKSVLLRGDEVTKTKSGRTIMEKIRDRKFLKDSEVSIIVRRTVDHLIDLTPDSRPSTISRALLAMTIVEQLFSHYSPEKKCLLKMGLFKPSCKEKVNGKTHTKSPGGKIQDRLKYVWGKMGLPRIMDIDDDEDHEDNVIAADDEDGLSLNDRKSWLQLYSHPEETMLDHLKKTFPLRRRELAEAKSDDQAWCRFLNSWERLFHNVQTINQEFSLRFPSCVDSIETSWPDMGLRIYDLAEQNDRALSSLDLLRTPSSDVEKQHVAFLCLPYLIRSIAKGTARTEALNYFVTFVSSQEDLSQYASEEMERSQPFVLARGIMKMLQFFEFFVVAERRVVKCSSLQEAIGLCLKMFFILEVDYPAHVKNVWKFFAAGVFKIRPLSYMTPGAQSILSKVRQ